MGGFDCEINGKLVVFNFCMIVRAVVRVLKVPIPGLFQFYTGPDYAVR